MTSPIAFKELTLGRGRETDGVWLHRGGLTVRGTGGANNLSVNDQTLISYNAPRLSQSGNASYSDAHLRIDQAAPSEPRIGFHESGSSAVCLYKPSGQNALRIRGNSGEDYPVIGGPGSAQQLHGSWFNPSGWSLPQTGVWTETEIRVTYTNGAGLLRFEFQVTVECPSPPLAPVYLGLGLDGSVTWPALAIFTPPGAGYVNTLSGRMYHQPSSAGTHRVGVFMYGNAGAHVTASAWSGLWVTEQKA